MHTYVRELIALVVVTPLAVAGCSSSSTGRGAVPTPPTGSSTAAPPPISPDPASTAPTAEQTVTPAQVSAALLTPAEVGHGFSAVEFRRSSNPLPCLPAEPTVEQKFPAQLAEGTAMVDDADGASLSEELRLFDDDATAQRVIAFVSQGLDCASGRLALTGSATTISIGKQQDITTAVDADAAFAVQATAPRFSVVLVASRLGRAVALFAFLRTQATPTNALPNPIVIVKAALDKIKRS